MVQTCGRCSRVNPPEALYCYYDGSSLGGRGPGAGPVAAGSQPFPSDFVFPSGRRCRSFDELAIACQEEWPQAVEMLTKGYLESFLAGLGRTDLALAAREAADFPDHDRGLDKLLAKLPSSVLEPPRLQVEPLEVNLGQLAVGDDRTIQLDLTNLGSRLLYGSVACDAAWLGLGDGPGGGDKLIQFRTESSLPVHVRGQALRAGPKRLEGRIVLETNGGTVVVKVRAEVPVKPFPQGILSGARSPRQVAEKARAAPKEAAALFENGAVAQWYRDNGWKYPVQGPAASGLGAVQQFFEALGLTPPPRVDVMPKAIALQGAVGERLEATLKVETPEKRPVYAYGVSDQSWLEVGRAQLNGRIATLPLVVPAVPDEEGGTLRAEVKVTANGNQRFVVPVTLEVGGTLFFGDAPQVFAPRPRAPEPPPAVPSPEAAPAAAALAPEAEKPAAPAAPRRRLRVPWKHAAPAALLVLVLAAGMLYDAFAERTVGAAEGEPLIAVQFHPSTLRFGIVSLQERDPSNPSKFKRLTSEAVNNNTCIRLDEQENLFGKPPGRPWRPTRITDNRRWESFWEYPREKVRVTQTLEIVRGEQSQLRDTCLVRYTIQNLDAKPHTIGLRVMLDTYIGDNDGVPILIPGQPGFLETLHRYYSNELPDFLQAIERPDLKDPGTVAHLGLKLPGGDALEPIQSMLVSRWPYRIGTEARWEWEPEAMNAPGLKRDSCITLYWADRPTAPQEKREMAFTYGLGVLSGTGGGRIALTTGGSFRPGGTFSVTAYVKNPEEGQKITLRLPEGLTLASGEAQQTLQPQAGKDYTQVTWRVKSRTAGDYLLEVESGGATERYTVRVKETSIFD